MSNIFSISRVNSLTPPEACGGSGWAACYMKDTYRREILKLAVAAPGFVLIFKGFGSFFTGSTSTNK